MLNLETRCSNRPDATPNLDISETTAEQHKVLKCWGKKDFILMGKVESSLYMDKVLANWPKQIYLLLKIHDFHIHNIFVFLSILTKIQLVKIDQSSCTFM